MRTLTALACILLLAAPARAGLPRAVLDTAVAAPEPNAALPLALEFTDESGARRTLGSALDGRPAVLVFADFTCRTLCGPILAFAAAGLARTGLTPDKDYRLLVIGLDPRDTMEDARRLKAQHVDAHTALFTATIMLRGNAGAVRAATEAAGYRTAYDAANDQFAHPAAAFVVGAQGRIDRVLSPLALDGSDLRLALIDAADGRSATIADHIRLLCYGFDPATGIYTLRITRWLMAAALFTVAALAGGIALMALRTREPAP